MRFFIESEVPTRLRGDAGRIRQVLTNLVGNAIKFTQAGEVTVRVSCDMANEKECQIRFEVRDTGIGIAPETQKKLFQAFAQADVSTTRRFGGTGLGLAISRELAEKMGGSIGVNSALGQGATFWFTVRLSNSQTFQPVMDGDHPLVNQRILYPQLQKARVLIAEDNDVNRLVALGKLKKLGYTAEVVSNGRAVLDSLAEGPYDIILMDCQMPVMDGYEATRRIRARGNDFPQPYIIAMTAHAMRGDSENCFAAGMNDYVTKPIVLEALAAALIRGTEVKRTSLANGTSIAGPDDRQPESKSALCQETLQNLKELTSDMGESFFSQLLETFEQAAVERLAELRSAFARGETEQLRREARALKEVSLTIGAQGMADICQQLENPEIRQSPGSAPEKLARLDHEFDRVKREIETLVP